MTKDFTCKRCGKCCENLRTSSDGVPGGLLLTPTEAKLFDKHPEAVHPTVAFTTRGSKKITVVYYGMTLPVCPLFDQSKRQCTEYVNRPLVCKRYPIGSTSGIDSACAASEGVTTISDPKYQKTLKKFEKRTGKIADRIPHGAVISMYDPETGTWNITGVKK